ncbi:hypothetical protein BHECKSOX_2223 [Bathymodiolus heckerae thiotrophic gill symbiont]|uniref:hypothetical protein n=1 Tax=Bathymodiolus heckerae thiotrophic gill symbiont TaxID=1052212 RepID=UPI0010B5E53C|nr:hypothetical protein [Bathymodiolus heckerae thiotrophic gill symbiont]SHN91802.1 hypothetical protein BHECKSOX_2223 [Bathymodiolus heckerae thiotrophic gill symbiont]
MNKEFKRGFKSAFSFSSDDRTRERVPLLSTEERIRQSWESVGSDMKKSMDEFDVELNNVKETV